MMRAILLGSLFALAPAEAPSPETDRAAYGAAAEKAGRDAHAHLKLALWCEAHGLKPEELKHLALAVLLDPKDVTARGLLGLVAYRGRWLRPESVGAAVNADRGLNAHLAEYNTRRSAMAQTADAHWKLGLWCEQNGLGAEARAHFTTVTRLDPTREAAWKRLGCKRHDGRWLTETQIAAERDEAEAQRKADKHWKPLLAHLRAALGNKEKRAEAERALAAVTDPRAVPSIWSVFANAGANDQVVAVQLLSQLDSPGASRALALLAVYSDSAEVRRSATQILRTRDTREYLGALIALLHKRLKYEVRPVGGPGSPGVLFVEGQKFNVQRLYAPPPFPTGLIQPGDQVIFEYGLPVLSRFLGTTVETKTQIVDQQSRDVGPYFTEDSVQRTGINPRVQERFRDTFRTTTTQTTTTPIEHFEEIPIGQLMLQYQQSALVAQQQEANDVAVVENYNAFVGKLNDRVTQVLNGATGQDLGEAPRSWMAWWADQLGYAYRSAPTQPVPTFVQNVPLEYLPPGVPITTTDQAGPSTVTTSTMSGVTNNFGHSCFKAGTPVHTLNGTRPIETIQVGDQVLTQNTASGALTYQPVVAVFHNRPSETLRIELSGETVVATTIHRFWKPGKGWVMARQLQPGDTLRTLGGLAQVTAVASDQVQPVFNLQVADGQSFFVGTVGTLVHDNSVVEPVTAPFDAAPELSAVFAGSK